MGPKLLPSELNQDRKARTELTISVKDGRYYLSNWSELSVSEPNRPKLTEIYVGRDAEGDITNHIIMAETKGEEKHIAEGPRPPKEKIGWILSILLKKFTTKNQ